MARPSAPGCACWVRLTIATCSDAPFGTTVQPSRVSSRATDAATITSNHRWYGTLEGRLGYTQGPWLVYAKGGAAWINVASAATRQASRGRLRRSRLLALVRVT